MTVVVVGCACVVVANFLSDLVFCCSQAATGRHVITRSARSLLREQREPAGESGGCLAGLGTSSLA